MTEEISDELIERIIALHTEYRYITEFTTESEIEYIRKRLNKNADIQS